MLQFRVLGSLDLRGEEGEEILSVLSQPKRIALLSYLAVAAPRGFHRRDRLVGLLWPDLDQDRARAALRKSLHHLRQSLGEEAVLGRGDEEVSLNWVLFELDVARFEESLEGRPGEALDLYRGHLLDGFYLAGCTEFDRWAETERERLRKAAAGGAWAVAHHFTAAGLLADGERMAQRALALMPTDEAEVRRFIEALARAGDRAAALRFYENFSEKLHEELDLRPDAESRELVGKIRDSILLPDPQEKGSEARELPAEPEAALPPSTAESLGGDPEVADPAALFERFKLSIAGLYEIEREIGRGGMATVYLAKDLKHDRPVAVKVMRPELSAILGGERFLREIRIAAKLNHPHILALHDSGSADGVLYYVMPYVEGESLRAKLDRERELSVDETVAIARQVGSALDHAHEKGIVHRDIKPENILIHQGEALVSDFGIAVAVSAAGGTRLTDTGLSLGTPEYMSPEQATGEREVDARSDLYSLGVVVYEMLVGEPPHTGKTVQAIIAKVVSAEPQPVSRVRQSVPDNVDAAVMCAVAKTPADRFSSGVDFSKALTDPAFTRPSAVSPPVVPTPVGPWKRLAILFASIAAIATAFALWTPFQSPPLPPGVVHRVSLEFSDGEVAFSGWGRAIAISPDGCRVAYTGPGGIWLRSLAEEQGTLIPGTDRGYDPFFSPGGERIGFLTGNSSTLRIVSTTGSVPETLVAETGGPVGGVGAVGDWGADDMVYFGSMEGGLSRIPPYGEGEVEELTRPDTSAGEIGHTTVDVLPNGKGALFTIWKGERSDAEVAVVEFENLSVRRLTPGMDPQYAASGHMLYVREDGVILAAPFDQETMRLLGPAVPMANAVEEYPTGMFNYAVSRTGTLVRMEPLERQTQPVWVDREGAVQVIDPGWVGNFYFPALSPDGSRLALSVGWSGERYTWIRDLDQGSWVQLVFDQSGQPPIWSPDGQRISYSSGGQLWEKPADGTGAATPLPVPVEHRPQAQAWSRDGEWLVYQNIGGDTHDIYSFQPGAENPHQPLVATEYDERSPALSPDGRWLAYESNQTGRWEIHVRPFPNTDGGEWRVSAAGGLDPQWSHDGPELFFLNGQSELVSVEYEPEPTFRASPERRLFSTGDYSYFGLNHNYAVAPDDDRFVFLKRVEGMGARKLKLVINFFEELKEKVGG